MRIGWEPYDLIQHPHKRCTSTELTHRLGTNMRALAQAIGYLLVRLRISCRHELNSHSASTVRRKGAG